MDNGFNEGRKGFTLPGNGRNINYFSRLTVSSNDAVPYAEKIFVSGSTRTAGAIDSLYWHGKEFINSYDHGRQLQIAVADARYGECLNPTEAGGRTDGVGTNTSALNQSGELLGLNSLYTVTRPAYWLRPGESGAACGSISTAVNTANTSPSVFSKNILVGAAGFSNVIGFNALISYNESFPLGDQIEGPTGYIAPDVNFFYTFDLTNPLSQLTALSIASNCDTSDATVAALVRALNGCKISTPVIASTQDGSHAMGIYNPHLHSADPSVRKNGNYEFYFVDSKVNSFSGAPAESNQFKATAKWATRIVENNRNIYGGCSTEFNVYIVIGTKDVVYATMRQLYSNQMSGLLPNPVSNGTQCP